MTVAHDTALARRNGRLLAASLLTVAGMVGLSFAAVPLYDLFCRVTGFGGTTQVAGTAPEPAGQTVLDQQVDIRFISATGHALPWDFQPTTLGDTVRIGEASMAYYTATNTGDLPVAGTAVYNVTPPRAGLYFYKMQCFCFEEQIIEPGRTVTFPVWYYVDPAVVDDPQLDGLSQITLSYTFYPTESDGLRQAIAEFQRERMDAADPSGVAADG